MPVDYILGFGSRGRHTLLFLATLGNQCIIHVITVFHHLFAVFKVAGVIVVHIPNDTILWGEVWYFCLPVYLKDTSVLEPEIYRAFEIANDLFGCFEVAYSWIRIPLTQLLDCKGDVRSGAT